MSSLFELRRGEGRITALSFLALLGVTAGHTLIETARDALFLARIPATHLPALYITIAAAGLLTSRVSASLADRKKRKAAAVAAATPDNVTSKKKGLDSVALSMIGAALITLGFWALTASPTSNVLYALYVFSGMFAGWVAGQLWLRFGGLFTVAQAKRLYGAIGTGAVLGAVLGSALARAALAWIDVRHLLLAAAILLVLTALGPAGMLPEPTVALRSRAMEDASNAADAKKSSFGAEVRSVTGHPYLVRLLLLTLLAACCGTAIDFLYKREIAQSVAPAELGSFIATVSLGTNLASLLAQSIGVGVIVRWIGVHRALYVMPFLLAIGGGAALLGGALYAVLALRGVDGALRYSLHKTTTELLFVPLPDSLRSRAKPIIDLIGQRGGQAVASLVLLALATFLAKDISGIAVGGIILGLALVWLVLARTLRPRYLEVFRETLRKGRAELTGDLPALDMGALETLIAALSSRRDAEVLGALDLLADQQRGRLIPSLVLYHPSKPIVLRALELLVREGRADIVDVVDRLIDYSDPEIRAAALRARVAVEPDPDFLRDRLRAPHEEVRATALVALVVIGELTGDEATTAFDDVTSTVEARRALARAIAEVHARHESAEKPQYDAAGRALIESVTLKLARDDDKQTRALAATAMGALGSASFGPVLISLLGDRTSGLAAVEALGVMGTATVHLLDETLDAPQDGKDDVVPAEIKWRVIGALARSVAPEAVSILIKRMTTTDDTALRSRILRALRAKQSSGVSVPVQQADLLSLANGTIAAVARALALRLTHTRLLEESHRKDFAATGGAELIQRLLRDKEVEGIDRLFLVLSLLYPTERFPRIQRGLESADAKARASARELLENVLRSPLRESVLSVVDEVEDHVRLSRIGEERTESTYEELLRAMIAHGSELGALAVFHANEIGMRDSINEAIRTMDASGAALARELSSAKDLSEPA